ncbi:MAG: excinuclease ABC subunit UvrC [Acidobacteria bacterium]|nr:excinuclease ABC subunit UvrC [Acidobacteriota bacterium]
MEALTKKIRNLPSKIGVYVFLGSGGKILYVGKAVDLKRRVASYLKDDSHKSIMLRKEALDLEFYVTNTEVEALILEHNLIKKHQPRYNVLLKDDKTYPYIEIRMEDEFPGIYFSRKCDRKGSRYFGPFPSAGAVRRIIGITEKFFQLRTCGKDFFNRKRPCLKYQVKRCSAPCVGYQAVGPYRFSVEKAALFLGGHYEMLEKTLIEEMKDFSSKLAYEKAGRIRDLLAEIRRFKARQSVFLEGEPSLDAVAAVEEGGRTGIVILHFRAGRLLDKSEYLFESHEGLIRHVLEQHLYRLRQPLPMLLTNRSVPGVEILESYHRQRFGRAIEIRFPKRGRFLSVIRMVEENARELILRAESRRNELKTLQIMLGLKTLPERMECIDISHLGGEFMVGSLVSFKNGEPDKGSYRRFRIRHGGGNDDFRSVAEVVKRRYVRVLKEKGQLPDLVLIDGGKGQLSAAREEMEALGILGRVELAALAKKEETVFSMRYPEGIILDLRQPSARILIRLRDEAHRFAITFNRELHGRQVLSPGLTEVPGIGEKKARKLMAFFGSLQAVLGAEDAKLAKVIGLSDIRSIREYFGKPEWRG